MSFWWKNWKLKEKPEKTQGKIQRKLKNRQLQLSWVAKKTSKNKPCLVLLVYLLGAAQ